MKRNYQGLEDVENAIYFVGPEVEHTSMFGKTTLFKVGDRPLDEILEMLKLAEEKTGESINHVYFTANHSLPDIKDWSVLHSLLEREIYVTVDGFYNDVNIIKDYLPLGHPHLILMLAFPAENLMSMASSNTFIKIDDIDFAYSNTGVWVSKLFDVIPMSRYTPWSEYKKDVILKTEST